MASDPSFDETTDGPDLRRAQKEIRDARAATRRTDQVVTEANQALTVLRQWHQDNHFADKLRIAIRGVPQ